jgi:diazepam-binding inhibitor (GABA receptor modulator, acyl-CoA-binding protein)
MSDLKAAFEAAVDATKILEERPDNQTLLRLYALYKQATKGDASGDRPGFTDFVGRAKFDAWASRQGTSADAAMQAYLDLFSKLKG